MNFTNKYISFFIQGHLIFLLVLFYVPSLVAKPPVYSKNELKHHPSKIIRTCCAFGADLRLGRIPFLRKTDITAIHDLGTHQYMGSNAEGNGIIYTRRGGFVDIAHVRDVADWTGYLYLLITDNDRTINGGEMDLGMEGGQKYLKLKIPANLDQQTATELAGLIAYDISVWHEIASWFGASFIPLMPERYSSFSPEDLYSNLLGVHLGIQAIQSDLEYNEAMTQLIVDMMDTLGAVKSINDTYIAMKKVEGIWWSNEKPLPSRQILISRYLETDHILLPWQLDEDKSLHEPYNLEKPDSYLDEYFELNIALNRLFFKQAASCLKNQKTVTQRDFTHIIACIAIQADSMNLKSIQEH
ncbi:MAG: DUF4056 domain-containing protein [Saprospiraceae bacterium]|nr:DUF4056 domain-containing protein [Saprospiraceae bacterium]